MSDPFAHGIARCDIDSAGGELFSLRQDFVRLDGVLVTVVGDGVAEHPPHPANAMAEGCSWFRINGIPVCREGHRAQCGHPATGAAWARIVDTPKVSPF